MNEKVFYKFKNYNNYTKESLEERYFYFSTPSQLNDPIDCRIPISYEATNDDLWNWINHIKAQADYFHKDISVFNNWTPDFIRNMVYTGDFELSNLVNNTIERFHLLSLTDCKTNINMWKHKDYCKNFSGLCIGYKAYQLQPEFPSFFIQINNDQESRFFVNSNGNKYFILKKIEYDNDRSHKYYPFVDKYTDDLVFPLPGETRNNNNIQYNFFHKTKRWNKENEFRGFYNDLDMNNISKIYYPDSIVESITFGKNCPIQSRKEIYKIMKTYSNFDEIQFFEARPGWKNIKASIHSIEKELLESL